ncbi:MAG: zf-HC2 domain-containing protein [Acidobacteriota bacterium]
MAKKAAHPDRQLFDYLSGMLDAPAAREVEEHLAACDECGLAAKLVRVLKSARRFESSTTPEFENEHPAASQIAALFYGKAARTQAEAAAHVATCRSCVEEIAQYARAEAAVSTYNPAEHARGEVPAAAWEMISEWEESSFAKPKPASELIGQELLAKLFNLLSERKDWLREARRSIADPTNEKGVAVIVVDRSGQLRRVEMFEKVADANGAIVLRHAEKSDRFDEKTVHALHDAAGRQRVASYRVQYDSIRFEEASSEVTADYFIIED